MNPLLYLDGYKTDHRRQYPDGTEYVYSNMTPRKSRLPDVDYMVSFGLQYFLKEYLINRMNNDFFNQPVGKVVDEYRETMDDYLGVGAVPCEHIAELHALGYLPLRIKALPEGTRVPIGVPLLTIVNTKPNFFWLTNQLETILSCTLWQGCTSATIADQYKKNFNKYNSISGIDLGFTPYQGHDFSFRGMSSLESACLSGAGHLTSFIGTDTIPAIKFIQKYYGTDISGQVGSSVPATEHSVMCMGGDSQDEQIETIRRLITKTYPKGIVSLVADTWDFWWVISEAFKILKPEIMARDGKVVARPDSGDPVKIIVGDSESSDLLEYKGAYQVLAEEFGTTITPTGYNQLDSHVGLIYGDSITLERQKNIMEGLLSKGYATDVVLGIGSYTYQYNTRDTFGNAVKATWGQVNGVPRNIFKCPKTDKGGEKKSAKGLLIVDENLKLHDQCTPEQEQTGMLKTVFEDGKLLVDHKFGDIRNRLRN